jgi:hypothetical protein
MEYERPRKSMIPHEIRDQVIAIVNQVNVENALLSKANPMRQVLQVLKISSSKQDETQRHIFEYDPRFRGAYLYLDRVDIDHQPSQFCRLKWTGAMDKWEFAIYEHSQNRYDPHEWFFPGSGEVDGTVTGAMRAGNQAYPV